MPTTPPSPSRRVWRSPAPELSLVALVVLTYGDTLNFGYIWDDTLLVGSDWRQALERSFQGIHVRPVWYLSYVFSQRLAASAAFKHGVNLALFAAASVLAYRLALAWLGRRDAAWTASLVWTLLPWNAYPVSWISQRNDLLIFVFGFAAVLAVWRDRYTLAWLLLVLATFSKVTIAFVPLFFVWRAHRHGRRRAAFAFGVLFITYLALALAAYALYFEAPAYLDQLGWGLRLLRFPLHWLEHLVLLAVPVPFFLGIGHALLYLAGFAGLLLGSTAAKPRAAPAPGGPRPGRHDALLLALLASVVTAFTPELRICGFESLFWILALAGRRHWRSPAAAIALVALLAAYGASIAATKAIFDTRRPPTVERPSLYPNDYYRHRRAALSSLFEEPAGPQSR